MSTEDVREPLSPYIATILTRERDKQHVTQATLEARSGISQSTISKYLRAERIINVDRLDALCAALDLDIVDVVREAVHARDSRS